MESDGFVSVGSVDSLKATGKVVHVTGTKKTHEIAVFKVNGKVYAIENLCAHKQAQLSQGDIEDLPAYLNDGEGTSLCVRCPKHRKKFCGGLYFNLDSGRALTKSPCEKFNPSWKVAAFETKIKPDGTVLLGTSPINNVQEGQLEKTLKNTWAPAILTNIKRYNHNTFIYDFTLQALTRESIGAVKDKDQQKILKSYAKSSFALKERLQTVHLECWHLDLQSPNHSITREYTPISSSVAFQQPPHHLQLLIKLYEEGAMSQVLAKASVGDTFFVGPPKRTIEEKFLKGYKGTLGCVVGGTGITPFYQMMMYVLEEVKKGVTDVPKVIMLYSNKKAEDILLKEELNELVKQLPNHFTIYHTLTQESPNDFDVKEGFFFGRIGVPLASKVFPIGTVDHLFVSGPTGMWETVLQVLKEVGFKEEQCTELEA